MRMQLTLARATCAIAIACGLPATAAADERAAAWVSVYDDDDGLTVISPQVSARGDVSDEVEVGATYDVDIISAASIDVTTAASPRGYDEVRHGLRLAATWAPDADRSIGASYLPSWEPDYRSHAFAANARREWLDRRLETSLDARIIIDRVGRSGDDMSLWRDLTTVAGAASAALVVDRYTVAQLAYELQTSSGFMSSPYRFVTVSWTGDAPMDVSIPEAVPDDRLRHAVAAGVRRGFDDKWFAIASYRLYTDDWGIVSHTADAEVQRAFGWDKALVGFGARAYRQGAADFYARRYDAAPGDLPGYRTADKMLAESWSVLGSVRAEMSFEPSTVVGAVRGVLKIEAYHQRFVDFEPLQTRRAVVVSVGASVDL